MKLVSAVLDKHTPSTWDSMSSYSEVKLVELSEYSSEYEEVKSKIKETSRILIKKVVRVQNPYLWGCYQLKKAECTLRAPSSVEEKKLFHATAQDNIESITEDNLDWRRSWRTKYGEGVSFSPYARYANTYCNLSCGTRRAFILARVLVGKSAEGNYSTELPPPDCDTTVSYDDNVIVKYCDNEFYPEYIAYYNC
ncbi:hypothetical protein ANN_11371 [Periplaneta americana]|uniref:Poly [ADP-ribose] polymerase n=1 Tax=Periplaneta americana TaxID=6978 RepID=A0ABQ8T6J9_PERAM|nr:hypothetical protein ANN_11371 [Periplaneta americana]